MAETPIAFDFHAGGVLQLVQTVAECRYGDIAASALREFGIRHSVLNGRDALAVEPALRDATARIAGGLHLPSDASGDSHIFCQALTAWLQRAGVKFDSTPMCGDCCMRAVGWWAQRPLAAY
jgi:D-amino-acid dehydrogenase